jgi:hypothetical protein
MPTIKYRLYPCGTLISEDYFTEYDNQQPYYDDYYETDVPTGLEEDDVQTYIEEELMVGWETYGR